MVNSATARTQSAASARMGVRSAALLAGALGILFVFVAGFAHPEVLHNAAHDSRHSIAFPCH